MSTSAKQVVQRYEPCLLCRLQHALMRSTVKTPYVSSRLRRQSSPRSRDTSNRRLSNAADGRADDKGRRDLREYRIFLCRGDTQQSGRAPARADRAVSRAVKRVSSPQRNCGVYVMLRNYYRYHQYLITVHASRPKPAVESR